MTFPMSSHTLARSPTYYYYNYYIYCPVINLWNSIKTWLATLGYNILLEKKQILFVILSEQSNSPSNELLLYVKYFIWKAKHSGNQSLNLFLFHKFLLYKLKCKKDAFELGDQYCRFDQWEKIYDFLSRLP